MPWPTCCAWKASYLAGRQRQGGTHDIGFVAEDVPAVVPERIALEKDEQNAAGMNYDRVTALAVEAISPPNLPFLNVCSGILTVFSRFVTPGRGR